MTCTGLSGGRPFPYDRRAPTNRGAAYEDACGDQAGTRRRLRRRVLRLSKEPLGLSEETQ